MICKRECAQEQAPAYDNQIESTCPDPSRRLLIATSSTTPLALTPAVSLLQIYWSQFSSLQIDILFFTINECRGGCLHGCSPLILVEGHCLSDKTLFQ